jgi:hypothetical protein
VIAATDAVTTWATASLVDDGLRHVVHRTCREAYDAVPPAERRTQATGQQITEWIRSELRRRYGHDFGFYRRPHLMERRSPNAPNWALVEDPGAPTVLAFQTVPDVIMVIPEAQARFDLRPGGDEVDE